MYVVGVDGGTTKTIALVADDQGRILSAARGGGSNWSGEDVAIPMQVVIDTVREATERAGLASQQIDIGVFTLAGADWPEDHIRRAEFLSLAGIVQRVQVKNDSFGGMRAGLHKPYGMVLAAGTGMNAAVITPDGTEWAFGYYETFGGAGSLVQDAFTAILRAEDGRGQPTLLTKMMLIHMGYPTVEALLRASVLHQVDYGKFSTFAPLVFEAALKGDPIAEALIIRQGKGLAEYATAMARRFQMCDIEFDIVLAGSLFKGVGSLLVDTLTQEVHQVAPRAHIVRARFEPAVGAVLLAYDALGIQMTDAIYARLEETAPGASLFDTSKNSRPAPLYSKAKRDE